MSKTFDLDDINTIECDENASGMDEALALQRAINGGLWSLQGSYGRAMMGAINDGRCMLGTAPAFDYFNNRIPSRDEVQSGTKGSYSFVVANMGLDWAEAMEDA